MIRWSGIQGGPDVQDHLRRLLQNPRTRGAGALVLQNQSRKLKEIAEGLAEDELHRRPDDRRTKESLAHGPEYHDSFEIVAAREDGYNRLRAGMRNTHPMARAVENGTPAHDIPASAENPLLFPYVKGQGPGDVGVLGNFPVAWSDAPTERWEMDLKHPGAVAHHIMRRARDRYQEQTKRRLNR